jgi:hypothetical protein
MKQSSIDWFLSEFEKQIQFRPDSELDLWFKDLFPKAKAMHKEEIEDAYNKSFILRDKPYSTAVKYYKETYERQDNNH